MTEVFFKPSNWPLVPGNWPLVPGKMPFGAWREVFYTS